MIKYFFAFIVFFVFEGTQNSFAQSSNQLENKTYRVALFAPLYLDSMFTGNQLKHENSIPRFAVAGLDFIQGAQIAFDTLNLNGRHVDAFIYDSKSIKEPVSLLVKNGKLNNVDLIIGSVKEPEYSALARFASQKKIPFVSATYPNDGYVRQNPFLIIANSTLKTHCEAVFNYLLQNHGRDHIYLFKKKNDNRIDNYFKEINLEDGKPLLKIKSIMLDSSISSTQLKYLVDTTKPIVVIGASLDAVFSQKLADACYPIQKTNPFIFIGMPNWDGFPGWYKKGAYVNFPIRYTSPHYLAKNNLYNDYLNKKYFGLYRTKPSDMAEKGFEITYYFSSILLNHPADFMNHINDTTYAVFHNYQFRPVIHNKNLPFDYYENKHLFIMHILNGEVFRE
ncbi:MAG: ABC transporter substrate-binding protein [Ginsengibacter sp.]